MHVIFSFGLLECMHETEFLNFFLNDMYETLSFFFSFECMHA